MSKTNTEECLQEVLPEYHWGDFSLYAVYAEQQVLPKRTRLLLDFIFEQAQELQIKLDNLKT